MPWNNAAMLTDKDGNFIPQLWDPSQNKFIPWDGKVQQSGTVVETFAQTNIVLAAGASVVLNVTEMFPVVFAYNLLIETAQAHDYALKEYFSIGAYAAQTVTTKEIEMESTPVSRIKKTGKLEAENPIFLRFVLENKSTSSQTYNRVTATLFVRGDAR